MAPAIFLLSLVAVAVFIVALAHVSMLLLPQRDSGNTKSKPDQSQPIEDNVKAASPDFVALVNAIAKEGRAARAEEQREDDASQFREWLTIGLIALTLVTLGWQVSEMIRVYDPIKEQADAAKVSAKATADQVSNSEKASTQAQRAWVGPSNLASEAAPQGTNPLKITITYYDSGRSPGLNFETDVDWRAYDATSQTDATWIESEVKLWEAACRNKGKPTGGETVFPNAGFSSYTQTAIIPANAVPGLVDKAGGTFVFLGCFTYISFDVVRHSAYCFYFRNGTSMPQNWNFCASGNYAD